MHIIKPMEGYPQQYCYDVIDMIGLDLGIILSYVLPVVKAATAWDLGWT